MLSVFEETTTVNVVALRSPIHSVILCTTARTCARRQGCVSGGDALRGTQECMALCGFKLCVAWDSLTLQGFLVGAMHCMGLTHTSTAGRSRWVAVAVCRCVSRKAHTHYPALWLRLHQFAPLPVSWSNPCVTSLLQRTGKPQLL